MYMNIFSHTFYCCYKPLHLHWAFAVLWSFPFFFFFLFSFFFHFFYFSLFYNFNFLNLLYFFYICSFVCLPYCSFPHFLTGLFVFLALSCMSCLYILEINPLSVVSFAIIFSHSLHCLLTLLITSF